MEKKEKRHLRKMVITEQTPNLGFDIFAPFKKKLEAAYTDRKKFAVSIELVDVNCSVANALRRTIMDELDIKCLSFDVSTIKTNVDFLIAEELLDRIQLLPINQSIPIDTKLSLSVINKGTDLQILYSASLGHEAIPKRFRLAELRPGNFLNIPEIRVVSGKGRDHAKFALTHEYEFDNLDYMDCHILNAKGNRLLKRVSVSQLFKLIYPKHKVDVEALRKLKSERVLVIPNKSFESRIEDDERARIEAAKYDHIVVNPETPEDANEFLPEQSSFMTDSREFGMTFYITAQIQPEHLISMACESLIERLTQIGSALEAESSKVKVFTKPVPIRNGSEMTSIEQWHMTIMGETHTIGQLLVRSIFDLDPNIAFVGQQMDHPKDNRVTIRIIHPEAPKLARDAIAVLIKLFEKIKEESHAV